MSHKQIYTLGVFGDGSDGDVVVSTPITLTRDMYYNTLTINSGGSVFTDGYGIFAKRRVTINSGGSINCNGYPSVDEFTPGNPHQFSRFHGSQNGGAASDTPFDGVGSNTLFYSLMGYGKGGIGGSTPFGGVGGDAGLSAALSNTGGGQVVVQNVVGFLGPPSIPTRNGTPFNCASGGGSGAGNGVDYGGNSGGGGGGPVILICPYVIGAGEVYTTGGAGQEALSMGTAEIGGGGGGGGGFIFAGNLNVNWVEQFVANSQIFVFGGALGFGENGGQDGDIGLEGGWYLQPMRKP
jgi:hypothetical protein